MIQKAVAILLLATCALGLDTFGSNPIGVYIRGRDTCLVSLKISPDVAVSYKNFIFSDDPSTEEFLLCQHKDMGVWDSVKGIDLAAIKAAFITLKREDLIKQDWMPCVANDQHLPEGKWLRTILNCLHGTEAGKYFKGLITAADLGN